MRLFLDVVNRSGEERRTWCQRKSYESNRAVLLRTKGEREREREKERLFRTTDRCVM